ncbi:MAG: hypothetical protein M2R45_01604 [Verrucomicrobia subdivision 3 bacterium]|nr:hypothetical protein [Limisphaerales bacterium]MCS1412756.1 hypothetical protein [Limisphaerales bacterium]
MFSLAVMMRKQIKRLKDDAQSFPIISEPFFVISPCYPIEPDRTLIGNKE